MPKWRNVEFGDLSRRAHASSRPCLGCRLSETFSRTGSRFCIRAQTLVENRVFCEVCNFSSEINVTYRGACGQSLVFRRILIRCGVPRSMWKLLLGPPGRRGGGVGAFNKVYMDLPHRPCSTHHIPFIVRDNILVGGTYSAVVHGMSTLPYR
jgi:hypothetical protein